MNDNSGPDRQIARDQHEREQARTQQLAELSTLAMRAVAKPESLSPTEIQEIGWGFLMAARDLHQSEPDCH